MSLFGSIMSGEVGLRLLLCPLGSNVVVRTACCSVGVVLPVYSTFKVIEARDENEEHKWLMYWAAYGCFSLAEVFIDKILHWCPLYYQMKFAFLVWMQLPYVDGAKQLYTNYLQPFLLRHQSKLDRPVGFFYYEMVKFVKNHETEFLIARKLIIKILLSANTAVREIIHPRQSQGNRPAIEGLSEQEETSESDEDED